jgi:hypothetical protein
MSKSYRIPMSRLTYDEVVREEMRKHHWRRHFALLGDDPENAARHRRLAESVRTSVPLQSLEKDFRPFAPKGGEENA